MHFAWEFYRVRMELFSARACALARYVAGSLVFLLYRTIRLRAGKEGLYFFSPGAPGLFGYGQEQRVLAGGWN